MPCYNADVIVLSRGMEGILFGRYVVVKLVPDIYLLTILCLVSSARDAVAHVRVGTRVSGQQVPAWIDSKLSDSSRELGGVKSMKRDFDPERLRNTTDGLYVSYML